MRVLVGMSGGIDSSVAAYLLKKKGYEVLGVTMLIWGRRKDLPRPKKTNSCYSPTKEEEVEKTKAIARMIGIDHVTLDLSDLYESIVMKNFRDEYLDGHTPNPCVWCNAKIKFGAMLSHARERGLSFDKFATGHYARIGEEGGRYFIRRGVDARKDQSYFLYRLSQEQLSSIIFPLGDLTKEEVRQIDLERGFHSGEQGESQDFYGGDYADLLSVGSREGDIVMKDGKVVGRHKGIWHYTVGQRKGLGVAGERPLYVLSLDAKRNRVVVGYEEDTLNSVVHAGDIVWGKTDGLEGERPVTAKIRSIGSPRDAVAREGEDGSLSVRFSRPVKAATSGQSLVLYDGDDILCGGIITSAE